MGAPHPAREPPPLGAPAGTEPARCPEPGGRVMLGTLRMIGVIALAVGLFATAGWAQAQAPIDFKIGAGTASDHAPGFVGIERGIFAKHGLNAKIVMYPTGVEAINGLMAGGPGGKLKGSDPLPPPASHARAPGLPPRPPP